VADRSRNAEQRSDIAQQERPDTWTETPEKESIIGQSNQNQGHSHPNSGSSQPTPGNSASVTASQYVPPLPPESVVPGRVRFGLSGGTEGIDPKDLLQGGDDLEKLFTYQPPRPETRESFVAIAEACLYAARVIVNHCPPCAERTLAIRELVEARMQANLGISIRGARLIPHD